jgi:biotin carboxylase
VVARILVLDGHTTIALAVVRALGRAGYAVGVGADRASCLAAGSRHCRAAHALPSPLGPRARYAAALAQVVGAERYDCVLACDDLTIARLATIDLAVPTVPTTGDGWRRLTDKAELAVVAAAAGVRYPRTLRATVGDALDSLGWPLAVKAVSSGVAHEDRVVPAKGAVIAHDRTSAAAAIAALGARCAPAIVQECVARDIKLNAVVFRHAGATTVRYAHRVDAEFPTAGGVGVSLVSIRADAGLGGACADALEAVCREAGYDGIAHAEFYVVGGEPVLIDVNTRCWGSTWFGELQGLRVPERAVRAVLGDPALPPASYRPGRRFHFVPGLVRWLRDDGPERGARWPLLRTIRPWDGFDAVSLRDPAPLLRLASRR